MIEPRETLGSIYMYLLQLHGVSYKDPTALKAKY